MPEPYSPAAPRRPATTQANALQRAQKAAKGVKVGRPLTYHPSLCKRAIALGMKGESWAGIARAFNISRSTLNDWEGVYPEFRDALARARAAAQARFEADIWRNRKAKHYQAQSIGKVMAAQFEDYRETRSLDVNISLEGIVGSLFAPKPMQAIEGKAETVSEPPKLPKPEGDLS